MGTLIHSVAKQPYDKTLEENMSMYDKLPYKRDADMCNASTLCLNSGNLLKYYRCQQQMEAIEIATQDEHFKDIASKHIRSQEKHHNYLLEHFPTLYAENLPKETEENFEFIADQTDLQQD